MDAPTQARPAEIIRFPDGERTLIARVMQRDQVAFQQLYDKHMPMVYGLSLRLTGQPSQAEDVTQEVFIQVWRKIASFNGESAFSTWLHSLTTNTALSYLRKQRSWWQRLHAIDDYEFLAEQLVAERTPIVEDLYEALAKLPERARIIFVLHAIEGYRQESIAEVMGITTGTVKAQFHRAKQLLEKWFDNNAGVSP